MLRRDAQPKPDAARIAAPVPVEEVGEVLGAIRGASVVDREPDAGLLLLGAHRDASAGRRELERVADQVAQKLEDALAIAAMLSS